MADAFGGERHRAPTIADEAGSDVARLDASTRQTRAAPRRMLGLVRDVRKSREDSGGPGTAVDWARAGAPPSAPVRGGPPVQGAEPDLPLLARFGELECADWEREPADFWHTDVEVPAIVTEDGVARPHLAHLLNSNQDPTFLRSVPYLDIARDDIPAPRANRAAIDGPTESTPDARTLRGFAQLRRAALLAHPGVREAMGR